MNEAATDTETHLLRWQDCLLRSPARLSEYHIEAESVSVCTLNDVALQRWHNARTASQAELDAWDDDFEAPRCGPVLMTSSDATGDLLDYAPPSLQAWLNRAFPAWLDPNGNLGLLDPRPLSHWLAHWQVDRVGPALELSAKIGAKVPRAGHFSGRCHVCDFAQCGEPMCGCAFAEVQNGRLLLYMRGSGMGITAAWVLPRAVIAPHDGPDAW